MEASIPCWELLSRLGDDEVVVVDCRSMDELRSLPVQIPGAIRMTPEDIQQAPHALPDDELIVLCDGSDGYLARRIARALMATGRTAVALDGGLRAWLGAGYPTERVVWRRHSDAGTSISIDVAMAARGHG